MKPFHVIVISFCIAGCAQSRKTETQLKVDSIVVDSVSNSRSLGDKVSDSDAEEECIFDTSTYKFTTQALRAYDKKILFHWDKETATAFVRLNEVDSFALHIGGCTHFSYDATFMTDSSKFHDKDYLLEKTKWLAKSFFASGFDEKYGLH